MTRGDELDPEVPLDVDAPGEDDDDDHLWQVKEFQLGVLAAVLLLSSRGSSWAGVVSRAGSWG